MSPVSLGQIRGIVPASSIKRKQQGSPSWSYTALIGRFTELSGADGSAALTLAMALVADAQLKQEITAWVTTADRMFYAPDAVEHGVDLEALIVVRAPDMASIPRAAEVLLRSGGYGLVILDLGIDARIPTPLQARLVKLAQQHRTAVVCLTVKSSEAPSLGSMVSLHVDARRKRSDEGQFICGLHVRKDKHLGPTWSYQESFYAPPGLR